MDTLSLSLVILILVAISILVISYLLMKKRANKFANNNPITTQPVDPLISYIEQQDLLLDPSYYLPYSYDWYSVNYPYWSPYWLPYGGWGFGYYWPGYGYNYGRYRDYVNRRDGRHRRDGPRRDGGPRSGGRSGPIGGRSGDGRH